jgi:hypothetical protein
VRQRAQEEANKAMQALAAVLATQEVAEKEVEKMKAEAARMMTQVKMAEEQALKKIDQAKHELERQQGSVVTEVAPEIRSFLASYGLQDYVSDFAKALRDGWLDSFSQRLGKATGYRVIRLVNPDPWVKKKYQTYRLDEDESHLLLWKPPYWVGQFYYALHSEPIRYMQQKLERLGIYQEGVDGTVGKYTMKALMNFQRLKGLPATGIPDNATQFYLHHAERKRNWFVQVGSFMDEAKARSLHDTLQAKDYLLSLGELPDQHGNHLWVVSVGPIETKMQAQEIRDRLTDEVGLRGVIR